MFVGSGRKGMIHIFEPVGSRHPVIMGSCCVLYTKMTCFVKTPLQPESHMLPIPIKLCLKEGITCPVQGKSDGRLGSANFPVPTDRCNWPVEMPT